MDDVVMYQGSECWWITAAWRSLVVSQGWSHQTQFKSDDTRISDIASLHVCLKWSGMCSARLYLLIHIIHDNRACNKQWRHTGQPHKGTAQVTPLTVCGLYTLWKATGERVEVFLIRVNQSQRSPAPVERSCYPDSLTCVTQCLGLKEAQLLLVPADVCLISAMISSIPSCTEHRHPLSHSMCTLV